MTSPIRLTVSAPSKPEEGENEEDMLGRLIAQAKEREATEEAETQAAMVKAKKERFEHPEKWIKGYSVPGRYLPASYANFAGGEKAKAMCQAFPQKDIVLYGKTGCGKTHLAVATLRHLVQNDLIPKQASSWDQYSKPPAMFITVPNLLMEIRDSFKDKATESEKQIVSRYIEYPILILDDLGADRATEWAIETLYLIIDGRDSELKPIFITTNLSIAEIEAHYGARIASRIAGKSIIQIDMPDYRKRRG